MPSIRKEKGKRGAGGVLAGGVEKRRMGPKPKPLSERVQSWTFDKPKTRLERSYTRERKIEVLMYLVKHNIPFDTSYRKVARKRIGQYNEEAEFSEVGPDGRTVSYRSPTYKEASEFWKIPVATISNWWEHRDKILEGTGIELPKKPVAAPGGGGGGPPKPPKPAEPPLDPEEVKSLKEEQKEWLAMRGFGPIMKAKPQPVPQPVGTEPVSIQPALGTGQKPPPQPQRQPQHPPQQQPHQQQPPQQMAGQQAVQQSGEAPGSGQAQAPQPPKSPFPHHVVYVGQLPEAGVFLQHPAAVAGYLPPSAGGPAPWVVLYYGPPPGTLGGFPLPEAPHSLPAQVRVWQPPNIQQPNGVPSNGQPPTGVTAGYAPPPVQQGPTCPPRQPAPQHVQQAPPKVQQPSKQPRSSAPNTHPAKAATLPVANPPPAQQPNAREPLPGATAFAAAAPAATTLTPARKRTTTTTTSPSFGNAVKPTAAAAMGPTPVPPTPIPALAAASSTSWKFFTPQSLPPHSVAQSAEAKTVNVSAPVRDSSLTAGRQDCPTQSEERQGTPDSWLPHEEMTPEELEHFETSSGGEENKEQYGPEDHSENDSNSGEESTPYATPNTGVVDEDEEMADVETPKSGSLTELPHAYYASSNH